MATITFPIEATHMLMFARAIGDENPVYNDTDKAKDTEVGGIIAPPTFTAAVAQFNPDGMRPRPGEKWFGSAKEPTGIEGEPPSAGGLNAEQHFEYFRPVRPGERPGQARPGSARANALANCCSPIASPTFAIRTENLSSPSEASASRLSGRLSRVGCS